MLDISRLTDRAERISKVQTINFLSFQRAWVVNKNDLFICWLNFAWNLSLKI